MIKAIFWDNDGILVNTEHLYYISIKKILETIDINFTFEMYKDLLLNNAKGVWHLAREKGESEEKITLLREKRNIFFKDLIINENILIDNVQDTLSLLYKDEYKMAIVTSSKRYFLELMHKKTALLQFFDFTLTFDDYTNVKPDPEPYLLALEKSGLKKEECIIVEDSRRGLVSAMNAGIKCIIIPNEFTKELDFSGAFKILKNINGIPEVLKELN